MRGVGRGIATVGLLMEWGKGMSEQMCWQIFQSLDILCGLLKSRSLEAM
jgi:hypothetical protein